MPWPSLDLASRIADWANWFFIGSLVVGVVSTVAIVWMANVKEAHWDILRQRSNEQIAEANARQKEAELKLAQLDKKVTPRVISEEVEASIIDKLKEFSGISFAIETDATDLGFVNRVIVVLQRAGWKWQSYSVSPISLPFGDIAFPTDQISGVGVRINASRLDDFRKPAEALAVALTQALKAGVPVVFDRQIFPLRSPDVIHITIGRKL